MEKLPRISIITPSYQQAPYLEDTLQSVLNQGYTALEYIVMDGGSTDGSKEIIERYQNQLSYWVSERDHGQADGINKGLHRATGEIIAWINSDDYYLPDAFREAAEYFSTHPQVGLVYGDVLAVDGQGKPINVMQYAPYTLADLLQFNIIGQSSVFFRRSVLEEAGYLDDQYHFMLDHQLWIRMAMHTQIAYVPSIWSAARYHEGAKNIAEAAHFGEDARRIVLWAASEPALRQQWKTHQRAIRAGAAWLDAFYLTDAGQYARALRAYMKVLWFAPARFFKSVKKFVYALICWMGWRSAAERMQKINRVRRAERVKDLANMQGLRILRGQAEEEANG